MTPVTRFVIGALHAYKTCVSPLLPSACRFYPTCSVFAAQAVAEYGVIRGMWMAAGRLARCHPFHPGGFDPVPKRSVATR
jgi:putative membrane protein insertion efficiency factor